MAIVSIRTHDLTLCAFCAISAERIGCYFTRDAFASRFFDNRLLLVSSRQKLASTAQMTMVTIYHPQCKVQQTPSLVAPVAASMSEHPWNDNNV